MRQKTRNGDSGERGGRSENECIGIRLILLLASCQESSDYHLFPGERRERFQDPLPVKRKSEHLDRKNDRVRPMWVLLELMLLDLCSATTATEGRSCIGSLQLPPLGDGTCQHYVVVEILQGLICEAGFFWQDIIHIYILCTFRRR